MIIHPHNNSQLFAGKKFSYIHTLAVEPIKRKEKKEKKRNEWQKQLVLFSLQKKKKKKEKFILHIRFLV